MARRQKKLHIIGEFLALILVIPFLISLLIKKSLSKFDKFFILMIIIFTAMIDGYLLATWF